jgi:hypothetical protein
MDMTQQEGHQELLGELQRELGTKQIRQVDAPNGPIAYLHPGAGHPLLIFSHDTPMGSILRIDAPVAERVDWQGSGLAEMLLREQANWLFGRVEHSAEGIIIEHCLRADTPPDELASVVIGLADTALHLRHDLSRMGALTTVEEVV